MHDVFFFTDIHGTRSLFDAIMNYCKEQDPEAMIIFGGDACDRGPDGYKIMLELLNNPHVLYLKGNHEDMFCKAAREINQQFHFDLTKIARSEVRETLYWCRSYDSKYMHIQDVLYNSGLDTLTDWVMSGMDMGFVDAIEHLPLTFSYREYDFCHSGCMPQAFERASKAEYDGKPVDKYDAEALIWNRTALNANWISGHALVFGHTPVPYLHQFIGGAPRDTKPCKWNCGASVKIDMDTGACFTGIAYVMNMLTGKMQGFQIKDNGVEKIECV